MSKSSSKKDVDTPAKFNPNFKIPIKRAPETIAELTGGTNSFMISNVESLDMTNIDWHNDKEEEEDEEEEENDVNNQHEDAEGTEEIELGEYQIIDIPLPPVTYDQPPPPPPPPLPFEQETTSLNCENDQNYTHYMTESYYNMPVDGVVYPPPYPVVEMPATPTFDNFPKLQLEIGPQLYQSPMFNLDDSYMESSDKINRMAIPPKDQMESKKRKILDSLVDYYTEDTYPDELKKLMKPLVCDLCKSSMNSPISSKMHYQSKTHEKKVISWLDAWFVKTGERIEKKRLRPVQNVEGPTGPDAYHCTICDLKLTSMQHANQHYFGKKHKMAATGKKNPAGSGYWNERGVWVRQSTNVTTSGTRFGIGESFVSPPSLALSEDVAATSPPKPVNPENKVSSSTPTRATPNNVPAAVQQPQDPSKYCEICAVTVTSESQMKMHLEGIKHAKKLKAMGVAPLAPPTDTILSSVMTAKPTIHQNMNPRDPRGGGVRDISIYRTPSGQFYCGTCDLTVLTENLLIQHLDSKKHMKTLKHPTSSSSK